VFTYSERDHTEAITFEGSVPAVDRKRRNQMLRILSAKKLRQFYTENAGTDQTVLFEKQSKDGFMYGWTGNYIKVKTAFDEQLVNRLVPVRLGTTNADGTMNFEIMENAHVS
jgi:threonylcarbamoyladenosine tRNA methylthiotransferase MtaB